MCVHVLLVSSRDEKLAKGVSTVAERKWVSEVLTVLKHALFKAISVAAGDGDPDEGNQVNHTPHNHITSHHTQEGQPCVGM